MHSGYDVPRASAVASQRVVPSRMADSEFEKFSTELGLVLKYVKHSNGDEDLAKMIESDERYRRIGAV